LVYNGAIGAITLTTPQEIQAGQTLKFIVELDGYTPSGAGFANPRSTTLSVI
jgi:hypothetical protein